jgi:hypothetical protein
METKHTQHTPGEWDWHGTGRIRSGEKIIADIWNEENGWISSEEMANARLIATAPKLLAALQKILAYPLVLTVHGKPEFVQPSTQWADIVREAEAALAQALGQ